ncbi:MAG: hypothetical protein NUW37_14400 [Planctomycetes bacterium]|nr:hypothetical protein [Planctomycetota bacterium]
MRNWKRPTYNLGQRQAYIAIERVLTSHLGKDTGGKYQGVFPLGIYMYKMKVDQQNVTITRFSDNASSYDALYYKSSEKAKQAFENLGYI